MDIYILEKECENLYPLTCFRKICDLKIGGTSLNQKVKRCFPDSAIYSDSKKDSIDADTNEKILFLNARAIIEESFIEKIKALKENEVIFSNNDFVCSLVLKKDIRDLIESNCIDRQYWEDKFYTIKSHTVNIINNLWDIIALNKQAIEEDFLFYKDKCNKNNLDGFEIIGDSSRLFIGNNVKCCGTIVINLESGPVIIEDDVILKAPTIIEGPVFIDKGSLIDGAKVRSGTSIGEVCKISGEVESSIFHSYSNKHHEGFVGHSYVGSWVNMGALTTTSDLKNNYHSIKFNTGKEFIDTEQIKLGSFIGDFTTFGIGSLLPAGSNVGPCCNIFGGGLINKYYKSFSWHDIKKDVLSDYRKEDAIATFKTMFKRRGVHFTKELESIMRK